MVDLLNVFGRVASSLKAAFTRDESRNFSNTPNRRRPRDSDGSAVKLFVGNLPYAMNDDALRHMFERYGEVASAAVVTDRMTSESRGFGFVEMPSETDARTAIDAANGKELEGRAIIVDRAKSKSRRSNGPSARRTAPRRDDNRGRRSSRRPGSRTDHRTETERRSR